MTTGTPCLFIMADQARRPLAANPRFIRSSRLPSRRLANEGVVSTMPYDEPSIAQRGPPS